MDIRTGKGKLFGTVDADAMFLHIKDGKNIRMIKIPPDGLMVQYASSTDPPETIYINNRPIATATTA